MQTHPLATFNQARPIERKEVSSFFSKRISAGAATEFTRSFAIMLQARLPLLEALDICTEQASNKALRRFLLRVKGRVHDGQSLTKAFTADANALDALLVNLIEVGEAAGILPQTLLRAANYLEKKQALKRKMQQALAYPSVVLGVATLGTLFLLTFIVPTFAEMFADFDAELPGPTLFILSISNFITTHAAVLTLTVLATFFCLKGILARKSIAIQFDRLKLRIPLIGPLIVKSLSARLARTLSTLINSGIALDEAIDLLSRASGNRYLDATLLHVNQKIRHGASFYHELKKSHIFPPLILQMIHVGEETGELGETLMHGAAYYEDEVDAFVEGLGSIIEPILIVLIGIVMGSILAALYLPMFDLAQVAG